MKIILKKQKRHQKKNTKKLKYESVLEDKIRLSDKVIDLQDVVIRLQNDLIQRDKELLQYREEKINKLTNRKVRKNNDRH